MGAWSRDRRPKPSRSGRVSRGGQPPAWHALTSGAACERLCSGSTGLTTTDALTRLADVGPNELRAPQRVSAWALLGAQFSNVLIVILLVATALSALLGHRVEAVAITVIVIFAVVLGFVQEYRAEHAIEALRTMAAPVAKVLRDAEEVGGAGPRASFPATFSSCGPVTASPGTRGCWRP